MFNFIKKYFFNKMRKDKLKKDKIFNNLENILYNKITKNVYLTSMKQHKELKDDIKEAINTFINNESRS